ncbi:MAG: ERCC4 domain-containing protein [Candidatus Aminicenantia bacterium]
MNSIPYHENLKWLIYSEPRGRFPYRLFIEEKPGEFLSLRVQERWPGPGKKIFCRIEGTLRVNDLPAQEPLEKCNIVSLSRYGKKLTIILDRPIKKRCWFIFLKKEYKTRPGQYYDQVFWITQSSAVAERRGAYLPRSRKKGGFKVLIDINERYPYRFKNVETERKKLPVGDYALIYNENLVAVAERKTKDNFLHEIATFDVLKAKLQELSTFSYKAVVFESPYADFINPKKLTYYSASYLAELLADLTVEFRNVQFVFCSNRKVANEWLYRWFQRIHQKIEFSNDLK